MGTLWRDIRYSLRQIAKTPGFAVVAIVTLAVGIGTNAAVFSLINGWMLRPLPGERSGSLVRLHSRSSKPDEGYLWFSYPYFATLREENRSFVGLSAFCPSALALQEHGLTRTAIGAYVSSDFFHTFGVTPALGRSFTATEERPGSHRRVAIISHRLWRRLGSVPELVGQTIAVNDTPVTVVGVLPEHFVSASQITNKEIWLPLGMMGGFTGQDQSNAVVRLNTHHWRRLILIARLKPGMTLASVQSHLELLAAGLASAYPVEYGDCRLSVGSIGNILMSPGPRHGLSIRRPLTALVAISGCVLLIACLNLSHMVLARGMGRRREIAIRLALGSSPARVIRQLITESLLLSLTGGAVGVAVSLWSVRIPVRYFEQWSGGEGTIPIALDWRVALVGLGLSILSTLLFSLIPAWRLTTLSRGTDLRESRSGTASTHAAWRRVMVPAQVALAFVLVTCAVLFVNSARAAARSNPGFALHRGLLIELSLKREGRQRFQSILARLRAIPGLQAVSLTDTPPYRAYREEIYQGAGYVSTAPRPTIVARHAVIGADYFKSLGVPLLQGREFTPAEEQFDHGPPVAIIDEVLAQRMWPDENPIGRFLQSESHPEQSLEVVGVVPHLRDAVIERQANAQVYVSYGRHDSAHMFIHAQLGEPVAPGTREVMKKVIETELRALDPTLPIRGIRTWQEHIECFSFQSLTIKIGAKLFAGFGGLALGLATVGLFGIKSYWVGQRTREIGIRMALGATARDITSHVLREGLLLTIIGLGIGLLLTWLCTGFLESLLFDIGGAEPTVLLFTMMILTVTILLACYVPARRAAKTDPMEALRYE